MNRMIHLGIATGIASILAGGITGCSVNKKDAASNQPQATGKGFKSPPKAAGDSSGYRPIAEPGVPVELGFGIARHNLIMRAREM